MNKIISAIKSRLLALFTPSISTLVSQSDRVEAVIERSIGKESDKLLALYNAREAISASIRDKNIQIDKGYKLLNTISGLTK